ncbi:MAG: hypothetical protein JW994_02665 [Candidatus Omnitrophica bacterium]|nr:hypothetical protein [Candidatus Omnitrophota bacterium]
MGKTIAILLIAAFVMTSNFGYAEKKSSSDLLKEGLLGAGAGAVGGLASGGKGGDVWKGALAGAGVNIVGGALLDSISGEKVDSVQRVDSMDPQNAYGTGYKEGFTNGYKQGYTQGYKDGIKESMQKE